MMRIIRAIITFTLLFFTASMDEDVYATWQILGMLFITISFGVYAMSKAWSGSIIIIKENKNE